MISMSPITASILHNEINDVIKDELDNRYKEDVSIYVLDHLTSDILNDYRISVVFTYRYREKKRKRKVVDCIMQKLIVSSKDNINEALTDDNVKDIFTKYEIVPYSIKKELAEHLNINISNVRLNDSLNKLFYVIDKNIVTVN